MLHQAKQADRSEKSPKAGLPPEKRRAESFSKFRQSFFGFHSGSNLRPFWRKRQHKECNHVAFAVMGWAFPGSFVPLAFGKFVTIKPVIDVPKPENAPAWKEKNQILARQDKAEKQNNDWHLNLLRRNIQRAYPDGYGCNLDTAPFVISRTGDSMAIMAIIAWL